MPEEYGGLGASFAYDAAVFEDLESIVPELNNGVTVRQWHCCALYPEVRLGRGRKRRWLPGMARGELIGAIALTEPGTASDLQSVRTSARKQGNNYVINGQKTFITNGQTADLDHRRRPHRRRWRQGLVADRVGDQGTTPLPFGVAATSTRSALPAADTSELFFEDARWRRRKTCSAPRKASGFVQLMQQLPQERLIIAIGAVAAMERAVKLTADYTREAPGVRQADPRIPEHGLYAGRAQDRSDDCAGCSSISASSG